MSDVEKLLAKVRKDGMAVAVGLMHPGVVGMSAPIFDIDGDIVATAGVHKLEPGQKVKPLTGAP